MKKKSIIFLFVLILLAGCTNSKQSLLQELGSTPDTELASSLVSFFADYESDPATKIVLRDADREAEVTDPILIQRIYGNIMKITVKSEMDSAGLTGSTMTIEMIKGTDSVQMKFVDNKFLVLGSVAYEVGDASKLIRLSQQILDGTTPSHEKEFTGCKGEIISLDGNEEQEQMTAVVRISNTGTADVSEYAFTVVFLDENGKVLATKKCSQTLDEPLIPGASVLVEVNCDYREDITDVTFQ